MTGYNKFVFVFKVKNNVVIPQDFSRLDARHYVCIYREPVAELTDTSVKAVIRRMLQISRGPAWYKRGLQPLKDSDIIWFNTGYMLIPDPVFSGTLYHDDARELVRVDKRYLQSVDIDPEKILTCTA
jgi:hypothetical protein